MSDALESALIIELTDTIKWSAALQAPDLVTGRMTQVDPGQPLNILDYALRDREFQHRDLINAAAVAKVSIHARTVWSGTLVTPTLQGAYGLTDWTGTNVQLPLDPQEITYPLPVNNTSVYYVENADIPYDAIRVTDKDLYDRDVLLYETLARAAAIFPQKPINENDPGGGTVGSTSIWATAYGSNFPMTPNAAQALNQATIKEPDRYLAERDNQVAAYVSRLAQALKNPFEYASRIYVAIEGTGGRESETYVLTNNVYTYGQTYPTGEEVLYGTAWYRANYTTANVPGGAGWTLITQPTLRQYLAEPALSNRNRIVYNTTTKTLQWFRENLDTLHVPQIVGFYVPGVLPGQTIHTVPLVPENKDSEFYREKSARVSLANGTWESVFNIWPTAGNLTTGGIDTLFQSAKAVTLMMPDKVEVLLPLVVTQGTYAMTALVRPASTVNIAGGDGTGGVPDSNSGGVNFTALNTTVSYTIRLPAGGWKLYIEYANDDSATSDSFGFGVKVRLNSTEVLSDTVPLYYMDDLGNPLPKDTLVTSNPIDIIAAGQSYNLGLTWTTGSGVFHVRKITLVSTDNTTSHYIMAATWKHSGTPITTAKLDVMGQRDMPDSMPFTFYQPAASFAAPTVDLEWKPTNATSWNSGQTYYPGDQVIYLSVYWEADGIIEPGDAPPGDNALWLALNREPQIPLLIEQLHFSKWIPTATTPMTSGFAGFRQDMLERANRADQDAYRACVSAAGTVFPEFRQNGSSWDFLSTGSWMRFQEVYNPRLREVQIYSGQVVAGRYYEVRGNAGSSVTYNAVVYTPNQRFWGVDGVSTYTWVDSPPGTPPTVWQVGAYRLSQAGDVGQPALVPAGLEFVLSAGTVAGWYASYAAYPTIQALQPWMVEAGIYVAQPDFWSPPTM
jgi:hypothetical protein